MYRIGVDLGGTKTEAVLLDGDMAAVRRKRVPTPRDSYDGIVGSIAGLVSEIRGGAGGDCSVGICTPGAASARTGLVWNSNTRCLTGRPLRRDLEERLGQEVAMENDANCFALAEAVMGAARGYRTVFGVILGTGVGGGIVIDGAIHRGRSGAAGEWGHHTLRPGGNPCHCGRRGCAETYLSGPALEGRWSDLTGLRQPLADVVAGDLSAPRAARWKGEFLEDLGAALANVAAILDPDAIVLGGGVSNAPFLYDEGREAVHRHMLGGRADTPVLRNELGDSAGVFGACML